MLWIDSGEHRPVQTHPHGAPAHGAGMVTHGIPWETHVFIKFLQFLIKTITKRISVLYLVGLNLRVIKIYVYLGRGVTKFLMG